MSEQTQHTGYAALVGRPNVGKSTLLNLLLGQKLSITSHKPQTTRHTLLGIKTGNTGQIIYVDTPGLHPGAKRALNRYMNRAAGNTLQDVDVIVFMVEALRWHDEDDYVLSLLKQCKQPVVLAINKIDKVKLREELLPYIGQCQERYGFDSVFPISARRGTQVSELEQRIIQLLPQGQPLFPDDQITDRNERFFAAELVREKLMRRLGEEVPYRLSVEIEQFSEHTAKQKNDPPLLHIGAIIWVERSGQKAIVIGKQGRILKAVGSDARKDMERLFGCKVYLQLWVKVKNDWSDNETVLNRMGYKDI